MLQIGTHSGTFHCDEALGAFMLRLLPQYKDATIVRSRDPAVLAGADVVIDVGGVYDAGSQRYDHHQRGFDEVFGYGFKTKLSSAGLVYKHYGKAIIASIMDVPESHDDVQEVYLRVYKSFVQALDAIDNGVNQYVSDQPPLWVDRTGLSARVAKLNPSWTESCTDTELDARFQRAMALTGSEFLEEVQYTAKVWLPAKVMVRQALATRLDVDPSGRIIRLPLGGVPWKEHLYQLEEELAVPKPILFVLYEDERERKWRVQAVSKGPGSFENRCGLLAAWRGLRDDALSEASGIPGCVFVHISGFIGGNSTYDGALEMARRSVAAEDSAA